MGESDEQTQKNINPGTAVESCRMTVNEVLGKRGGGNRRRKVDESWRAVQWLIVALAEQT